MRTTSLLKAVPIGALLVAMNIPSAMAGATNRDENTAATPGEKATTTREATDQKHDRRKGTTQTDQMDTPTGAGDTNSSGNSGSGSGDTGSGNTSSGQ